MSRWFWSLLTVSAVITAIVLAVARPGNDGSNTSLAHIIGTQTPEGPNQVHLHIDANADNGTAPCDPVDGVRVVSPLGPHKVAVCVDSLPAQLGSFDITMVFDPALNQCTSPTCGGGTCFDDNPDANQGTTNWMGSLSGNPAAPGDWDCNVFDLFEPTCNRFGTAGRAGIACAALNGPYGAPVNSPASFPLFTVSFTAIATGIDEMVIGDGVNIPGGVLNDPPLNELGSCNPILSMEMPCFGAEVWKNIIPTNTPTDTPTETPTPSITPPPTDTPTPTDTPEPSPTPSGADSDGDGIPDYADNCPTYYNPDQENSDALPIENSTWIPGEDITNPSQDPLGDACDYDDDNDQWPDVFEALGCSIGPTDQGGDASYDDNQNGNAAPPAGDDLADDGASWDTDGDSTLDGMECLLASDPLNYTSKPSPIMPDDSDSDGLPASVEDALGSSDFDSDSDDDGFSDGLEVRGWGTSPISTDSDADGCLDWIEIVDVNGDKAATLVDALWYGKMGLGLLPRHQALDLNKDGTVTLVDALLALRNSSVMRPAPWKCS